MIITKESRIIQPKVLRGPLGTHVLIRAIAVDSQQIYVADAGGNLTVWKKSKLDHPIVISGQTSSEIVSLHSDDEYLYTGGITGDTVVRVYNQDIELLKILAGHTGTIFDLAAEGNVLATGSGDTTIKLWAKNEWTLIESITAQTYFVLCVAIDSAFVYAGGIDNCVNVFSRDEYNRVSSLHGHDANILALAVDSKYVYSGSGELWWGGPGSPRPSNFESAIRVWDKEDWSCISVLRGHGDNINSICVDNQNIYSASDDGTVKVFSKSDWSLKTSIDPGVGRIQDLAHDDRYIYFGCADGNTRYIAKRLFGS